MEQTLSSETSAFKLQTPGKFPKEHRLYLKVNHRCIYPFSSIHTQREHMAKYTRRRLRSAFVDLITTVMFPAKKKIYIIRNYSRGNQRANNSLCIRGSMHRNSILIRSNHMQQYAGIYLLQNQSTYFGCPSRPSSGIHTTVTAASGTGHSI